MKTKLLKLSQVFTNVVVPVLLILFFLRFVFMYAIVPTASMDNTIRKNDLLCVNCLNYRLAVAERGDVAVFDKDGQLCVKRIIGVSGDTIAIANGKIYLNGEELTEDYLDADIVTEPGTNGTSFTVPEGYVFLLGDNRDDSDDSRYWDSPYVSTADLRGKALTALGLNGGLHVSVL